MNKLKEALDTIRDYCEEISCCDKCGLKEVCNEVCCTSPATAFIRYIDLLEYSENNEEKVTDKLWDALNTIRDHCEANDYCDKCRLRGVCHEIWFNPPSMQHMDSLDLLEEGEELPYKLSEFYPKKVIGAEMFVTIEQLQALRDQYDLEFCGASGTRIGYLWFTDIKANVNVYVKQGD